jgi:GNAT superfamily N-acetyltransferase
VTIEDVLDGVYVDPAAMGTGVGRLLVDDALDRARAAGAGSLTVTANPNARPFYERVGFVATGEIETSFGPGQRMRIALRD